MSECSGWCQSLTSATLVAVLVLAILALIAWVVIDTINAQIRRVINSVSSLITPFISYVKNVVEYIKNNSPEIKQKLEELSKQIAELLNRYIKGVDIEAINQILVDKIEAYKDKNLEELKILNGKLSELLTKSKETKQVIKNLLDELDEFIIDVYESVNNSEIYHRVNNFINQLMNMFR